MTKTAIHIVYEYGITRLPHSSAYIRLLRPLTHPVLAEHISVTADLDYQEDNADVVIVDRTWRPDVTVERATALLEHVRATGARLIYAIDDNLLLLREDRRYWNYTEEQLGAVELFLRQADGVIVTTEPLREQLMDYNTRITVIPNLLDDRLLTRAVPSAPLLNSSPITIGYMGTPTHDDDLQMILSALEVVAMRYPNQLAFEIIGGVRGQETHDHLTAMGFRTLGPAPGEDDYPLFMLWFQRNARWDIGLAPLKATPFSEAKSDIKFLDYSAIGAVTLCSDVSAYAHTVRHGETGLCVENTITAWESGLETLITQPALRARLASNAWRYLLSERTVAVAASTWLVALERLID